MIEVLTSMRARLYGRRGARNRAMRAITATKLEPGRAGGLTAKKGELKRAGISRPVILEAFRPAGEGSRPILARDRWAPLSQSRRY